MIKVIVFDFDGVIIDSEVIKQDGYRLMFSDFGEDVPENILAYSREIQNNGISGRRNIIQSIMRFLKKNDEDTDIYVRRYSDAVRSRLIKISISAEVRDVLQMLCEKYPLYINSLTPDNELILIVENIGVCSTFTQVLGSSNTKIENLKNICQREEVSPDEILFIGDSIGDENAAYEFGCNFLMFDIFAKKDAVTHRGSPVIQSLASILTYC